MLEGKNIIVLDLETAQSADDCLYCGAEEILHLAVAGEDGKRCPRSDRVGTSPRWFAELGWRDKQALGLSIGCYWDYRDSRIHWFDVPTLEDTVECLVASAPLLVSFNGIGHDFALMRSLLRRKGERLQAEAGYATDAALGLGKLCDVFKVQCAQSYDLLAAIWKVDPANKFKLGLNSLGAIAETNGFGVKLSSGAQAPRDWRAGQYAKVLSYNQDDVYKTKALFEKVLTQQGTILRGDGLPITLPLPQL